MLRNKVVWDKHYYSNRFTVRNIFLLRYSRFRLMCTFKFFKVFNMVKAYLLYSTRNLLKEQWSDNCVPHSMTVVEQSVQVG